MKRLLLLPFLLLMPAAQAMDYVKCEAIQNAAGRIKASMEEQIASVAAPTSNLFLIERCGGTLEELISLVGLESRSERQQEFIECESATIKERRAAVVKAQENEREKINARLAKIQADYDAEGCY